MCKDRDERGRFVKGNDSGKETRAKEGNDLACKYKDEYCEQMLSFFEDESNPFPQFIFFALKIGVDNTTLINWCKEHRRFQTYYEKCKQIQLGKLMEGAIFKQFDPSFSKFVAINCHGMKEKVEQDTVVKVKMELPADIDEEAN